MRWIRKYPLREPVFLIVALTAGLLGGVVGIPGDATQAASGDTFAVLESASVPQAGPDISIYPVSQPKLRITVDARPIAGGAQNTKVPIGWVGSNLIAYAIATGQNLVTDPVYVQRIDSPRRTIVATNVLVAVPAPTTARIAVLRGTPTAGATPQVSTLSLEVADFARHHTSTMSLPAESTALAVGYDDGEAALSWSSDGAKIAAAWLDTTGIRLAVCTIATGHCLAATHGADLGLNTPPLKTRISVGWTSDQVILLAVASPSAHGATSLVTLPSGNLGQRPVLALPPGAQLSPGNIEDLSLSPTGGNVALVLAAGSSSTLTLQIAHLRGVQVVPTKRVIAMRMQKNSPLLPNVFAVAPQQAWSANGQVLTYLDTMGQGGRQAAAAWRLNVNTGRRTQLFVGSQWIAIRNVPGGTDATATGRRDAGSCPNPPLAADAPSSGSSAVSSPTKASVERAVAFYALMRQQALRIADGSCLGSVAAGSALASDQARVGTLARSGEYGVVSAQLQPLTIRINPTGGTATESAAGSTAETVYRDSQVVRTAGLAHTTVQYSLRLKHLAATHGQPRTRWIVVSVSPSR